MPGRRPRVAGYSVGSPAGHRVAVVAEFLGRADGEGCGVGRLWRLLRHGWGGTQCWFWSSWLHRGDWLSSCLAGGCSWAKALRFSTDDDGARGCRSPLEYIVAGLLPLSVFQVKTLVHFVGRNDGDALCRSPSRGHCRGSPGAVGHRRVVLRSSCIFVRRQSRVPTDVCCPLFSMFCFL